MTDIIRHEICEATRIRQVPSKTSGEILKDHVQDERCGEVTNLDESIAEVLREHRQEMRDFLNEWSRRSRPSKLCQSTSSPLQDQTAGSNADKRNREASVPIKIAPQKPDIRLDGEWRDQQGHKLYITGLEITYEDETTSALTKLGRYKYKRITNGEDFHAKYEPGKLRWSDGDVWTLVKHDDNVLVSSTSQSHPTWSENPWTSEVIKGSLQAQKSMKTRTKTRTKELKQAQRSMKMHAQTLTKELEIAGSDIEDVFESRKLIRRCDKFWHWFVNHWVFESVTIAVILVNALALGLQADFDARGWEEQDRYLLTGFSTMELLFTVYYCSECLARIVAYRCVYFCGAERSWNWFDFIVCIQAFTEQLFMAFSIPSSGANGSPLRVLRVLKTVKLLRVVRLMKEFRELRLIVSSIVGSMRSMVWSAVLIVICIYCFSVGIVQAFANYRDDLGPEGLPEAAVVAHWGTMGESMRSLYMASLGGVDWKECADPLQKLGAMWYMLFVMYIAFFFCVITNTLTSLFVDTTIRSSARDQAMIIQEEMEKKDEFILALSEIFDTMDQDGNGHVSYGEFCRLADDPQLLAFAASLDIDASDTKNFFKILSNGGTVEVDLPTFVVGCISLRGQAKGMDLYAMGGTQKEFFAFCTHQLKVIEDSIGELTAYVYSNEVGPSAVSGASDMENINGLINAIEL